MDGLAELFGPFLYGMLLTVGIGLIIGLEREFNTIEKTIYLGGIRTFILTAVLGYISAYISKSLHFPAILITCLSGFALLIGIAYFLQARQGKVGLTTELAFLITFLLGIAVAYNYINEALTTVVIVTALLSLKEKLHGVVRQITEAELFAFIKFILLTLLIIPLLPEQRIGPENLINLRDLGLIVLVVLTISFLGYLLLKFWGTPMSILFAAILGGLFSSTLIAWVYAARSREKPAYAEALGAGIILASSVMLIRVYILVAIFAYPVAQSMLFPLLMMFLASLAPAYYVWRKYDTNPSIQPLNPGNPLDIKNALFFAGLYVLITYLMHYSRQWIGDSMAYLTGAIAGIADIDAITVSTANWAVADPGKTQLAADIILTAILSNTIFKLVISATRASKATRKVVLWGFGVVLAVGGSILGLHLLTAK